MWSHLLIFERCPDPMRKIFVDFFEPVQALRRLFFISERGL